MNPIRDLANSIGHFIEYWGFKKVHGQIWTYIFLRERPVSTRELREELEISKSLLSLSLNELKSYHVVTKVGYAKFGSELYTANTDILEAAFQVLRGRELKMVEQVIQYVQKIKDLNKEELEAYDISEQRLKIVAKLATYGQRALESFLKLQNIPLSKWNIFRDIRP